MPPGQQLPLTQEKSIWKLPPAEMPWLRQLAPLLPVDNRISTEPFLRVVTVQLANIEEWQLTSAAGTPVSISLSEFQAFPLSFVKNRSPEPLAGMVKLKLKPTSTHCGHLP